ncbi:ATP-dependent protease La [Minicystis rosea]|nr:ATP-dependent protease La [Minicystis rosea]
MPARKLSPSECRKIVPAEQFRVPEGDEVAPLAGVASQERALTALELGLDIQQPRFHVVVVGASGTGRTFCARSVAKRIAKTRPTPDDMVLLPNPRRPSEPTVLNLPAGEARPFVDAMDELYTKLVDGLRGVNEGERYKQARAKTRRRVATEESRLEEALKAAAAELGLDLQRTDDEVQITALDEAGGTPSSDALAAIAAHIEEFETKLASVQDEADGELRAVVHHLLGEAVKSSFLPVRTRFEGRGAIASFLADVETAVTRELRRLVDEPRGDEAPTLSRGVVVPTLLTEHKPGAGAPVVEVPYPTLTALFGRTHAPPDSGFPPEPGFAVAGALHEANGGFLILPAQALLKNENLYEQLKACLLAGKFIVPEHNPSYYRGTTEELLLPPIPIDLKVVLIASPSLYQDLHEADPEFSQLFKIQARFEPTLKLDQAIAAYPSFLAGIAKDRSLPPLTPDAVGELVFYGGRLAESQTKVTAQLGLIAEVAMEAGYRAKQRGCECIDGRQVVEALAAARRRGSHFRDQVHELLADGTIRIDTTGERVGQVNAVSVLSDGPITFGRPCRVTAVVYPGVEGPVNIAREVEMSGPIHSKGVLVLAGFMALRFGQHKPPMFGASLVFEQTYEAIDGDSASSSELYALLSALSGFPLRQELAVTGSVDQQGGIQPVGGLNEKIEAFFDICAAKGLTGNQGVLIPERNCDALMLRDDVVDAIAASRFHVWATSTVEEGVELLAGVPAGVADENGHYPEGTLFRAVEMRLKRFHQAMSELSRGPK